MKYLTTLVFALILVMSSAACNRNELPSAINEPSKTDSKPEAISVSIGPGLFRSDKYHLEVQLPTGWAAVEGPEILTPTGHMEGQVAFNNWG